MAQMLAVPKDVRHRHRFSIEGKFNHDFGRITRIAASIKGNILLCDYVKKNLVLVDPLGNYLNKLNLDSEPYDVAITSQNIGYVTLPNSRSVLQIDPDRMIVLLKATSNELSTTVFCVSAVPNSGKDYSEKVPCFLGLKIHGLMYADSVNYEQINLTYKFKNECIIGTRVVRFHTVDKDSCLFCTAGQNYITYKESWIGKSKTYYFDTMDTPTDICSDDHGHVYVSGQGSNNIHRLVLESKTTMKDVYTENSKFGQKQDYKVLDMLDIPLDSRDEINEPVALCFNQKYNKLYIVNEWGKSVLVFDVV